MNTDTNLISPTGTTHTLQDVITMLAKLTTTVDQIEENANTLASEATLKQAINRIDKIEKEIRLIRSTAESARQIAESAYTFISTELEQITLLEDATSSSEDSPHRPHP
eukprot:GHVN01063324.1.p3 GENE.GHVN01063324.1~~GHVN01063324.1.p3  ORF type:complete len:109 (+),score=19.04 GHVN01063324.1:209-535(+)